MDLLYRTGYAASVLQHCLQLYLRILLGRERLDVPRFTRDSYDLGLTILPGVSVIAIAIGLILGIQVDQLLQTLTIPDLAINLYAGAVVTEFVPLLIGILVASRSGVELAVRIATMASRREIDGLIVSGINPVHYTVGATLLAVLLMSLTLAIWALLLVILSSGLWLALSDTLSAAQFINMLARNVVPSDVLLNLLKVASFALLATLIAATEGGTAASRPDGIAQAASRTMLQSIAWILIIDVLYAVLWP